MADLQNDLRARRREVGRTLLTLAQALARTLTAFDRAKHDPQVNAEARAACDDALREMRRSLEAVQLLRAALGPDERTSLSS